jgi:hypothetical protein
LAGAWLAGSAAAHAEISVGARYGAGLSLVYFTPYQSQAALLAPVNAALAFRYCDEDVPGAYGFERYMNILVEFGYAERGYKMQANPIATSDTAADMVTRKSRVLELPFVMQARIPVYRNFNFLLSGIVYGAYYLSNTQTYEVGGIVKTSTFRYNHFRGFEYGVGGGLGFSLSVGRNDFALDARYTASMSSLYNPSIDLYESMPMQLIISFSVMHKIGK